MCDNDDMPEMDFSSLMNSGSVPKAPETEEEIEDDSWEGFMKETYLKIVTEAGSDPEVDGKNKLTFDSFYEWRNKMGVVFQKQEVEDLWKIIAGGDSKICLMRFIQINKVIDETNHADE